MGPVVPCARPFMTWGRGCPSPLRHGHSACRPSEDIRQAPRSFLSNALRTLKNETTALWGKVENVKDGGPSALSLRVHLVPPHVAWCASGGQTSGQELGAHLPHGLGLSLPSPRRFKPLPASSPPPSTRPGLNTWPPAAPAPPWGLESEVGLPPAGQARTRGLWSDLGVHAFVSPPLHRGTARVPHSPPVGPAGVLSLADPVGRSAALTSSGARGQILTVLWLLGCGDSVAPHGCRAGLGQQAGGRAPDCATGTQRPA